VKTTILGRTGLEVSRLVLGGYPFGGVNRASDWDPWSTEGARTVIGTVNHALDRGINYIDTAAAYGGGRSEELIGEVMKTRRDECVLATKVGWDGWSKQRVLDGVHDSLRRLQTDHVDIVQFHGGMFTAEEYRHVVDGGPLEALQELKEQGKVGFIGVTAEEPWTARQFLDGDFDVFQLAYNFIYQAAARHVLNEAAAAGVGVVTMRTMTSGILQRLAGYLAPEWQDAHDLFEVCLEFVLADSRVTAPIVGMRWPHEVDRNVDFVESFEPPLDLAELPRMTADVYAAQDQERGVAG
jgi:aryl-alcohol dehydrogenase-like predicted oxidoreductase